MSDNVDGRVSRNRHLKEIIFCEECKWADPVYYHCSRVKFWNTRYDYCSRGERREKKVVKNEYD